MSAGYGAATPPRRWAWPSWPCGYWIPSEQQGADWPRVYKSREPGLHNPAGSG